MAVVHDHQAIGQVEPVIRNFAPAAGRLRQLLELAGQVVGDKPREQYRLRNSDQAGLEEMQHLTDDVERARSAEPLILDARRSWRRNAHDDLPSLPFRASSKPRSQRGKQGHPVPVERRHRHMLALAGDRERGRQDDDAAHRPTLIGGFEQQRVRPATIVAEHPVERHRRHGVIEPSDETAGCWRHVGSRTHSVRPAA